MTTIQGIINKGVINAEQQFDAMSYISTNIANYNTSGYKAVRFEQVLDENGYLTGVARTDFSQGAIQTTSRDFDIAINGLGFIPVTSPTGDVSYTRDGSLKLDKDGYLITNDGHLVGDGIQLPVNYENFEVKADGRVEIFSTDGTKRECVGTIPLVNFKNPEGLKKGDGNKFYLTAESGEPDLIKNHNNFKQRNLEITNVDMINDVSLMMRLNASMLASFKIMQTVNEMYSRSLQLNQ